jgi:hypothetical protein
MCTCVGGLCCRGALGKGTLHMYHWGRVPTKDTVKVLKRYIKRFRSEKCTLVFSASAVLSFGPAQVSWILGVTQGVTDADTRRHVG